MFEEQIWWTAKNEQHYVHALKTTKTNPENLFEGKRFRLRVIKDVLPDKKLSRRLVCEGPVF